MSLHEVREALSRVTFGSNAWLASQAVTDLLEEGGGLTEHIEYKGQ